MNSFEHFCPTKVIFGRGAFNKIKSQLPPNTKNVLLVSSKSAAEKSGALELLKKSLVDSSAECHYSNIVSPNPRIEEVDKLSELILLNHIDVVVAVGGGSVMDAAKAACLSAGANITAKELLTAKIDEIEPTFLIAVPTTSGTGSEVSKGAIVTDQESTWKGGIRGNKVFPKIAVLDPELTYSLPLDITLETGFDVVTHSLESLLSKAATPVTRLYSKQALELTVPTLVKVAREGADEHSRDKLMYASLLAGYNLANASTCLPHRLQYPLGAHTDSSHARGLASLYPAWIRSSYPFATDDLNFFVSLINQALEINDSSLNVDSVVTSVEMFLKEIKMAHKMSDFGTKATDCEMYANEVDGNLALDPGKTDLDTLIKIYKESL